MTRCGEPSPAPRLVRRPVRRRLRATRRARPFPGQQLRALLGHRARRRPGRLRRHPHAIRLRAGHRHHRLHRCHRTQHPTHHSHRGSAHGRAVGAAARSPAGHARSAAGRADGDQHHLVRAARRGAAIGTSLSAHARAHACVAHAARRRATCRRRRVRQRLGGCPACAHGQPPLAAVVLRRVVG